MPQPHPYLHEPLLYISNLPGYVTDENLAVAFVSCGPHRPKIPRDGGEVLSGTIEFKYLEQGSSIISCYLTHSSQPKRPLLRFNPGQFPV